MQKKEERSANRRSQILEAASICVRQKGFHAASMADIARTASMSVGHIYHYFENKDAIIAAIVDEDVARIQKQLEMHRGAQNIITSLLNSLESEFSYLTRDHAVLQIEVIAEAARNTQIGEKCRNIDTALRNELKSLIHEASGGRNIDARVDIAIILFEGIMLRKLQSPDFDIQRTLPMLKAIMRFLISDKIEPEQP